MEQSSGKITGELDHDRLLPRLQVDPAQVLLARSVLREQAGQCRE
jgi:hypothetical protein